MSVGWASVMSYGSLINLSRDEVHVWLAGDQVEREKAASCRSLLSPDERLREERFHFDKDRGRYLLTRALVRTVLSRYHPVSPRDWVFSVNAYGRPEIDASKVGATDINFNVSHTDGLIALAVTRGRTLGIDVENMYARESPLDVAQLVFTRAELADLSSLPSAQQLERFFQHWTLKESYIKARGMGVSIPLRKFGVRLGRSGLIDLEIAAELTDDPRRWLLWQMRPTREHVLAVCAERIGQSMPNVLVKRTAVLGSEEDVPVPIERAST